MTQEEKAKRYDEAIKRANELYDEHERDIALLIFPELKESEDEKIMGVFRDFTENYLFWEKSGLTKEKALAWLEKQKHEEWSLYDKKILSEVFTSIEISAYSEEKKKEIISWLQKYRPYMHEKQGEQKMITPEESLGIDSETYNKIVDECICGEQKPATKVEPKFKVGDVIKPKDPVLGEPRIIKGIHPKFGYDTNNGILDFEFEDNWELVEQNIVWSEEDERILNNVIHDLRYPGFNYYKKPIEENVKWLESLKDRVQPQQEQKWSEQDEKIYNLLYEEYKNIAYYSHSREKAEDIPGEVLGWLKSLKDRVQPKQELSDVDKDILFRTIDNLKFLKDTISTDPKYAVNIIDIEREITWLKSLRHQLHWKPSDEQMLAINTAINVFGKGTVNGKYLIELQEQLKKLRE